MSATEAVHSRQIQGDVGFMSPELVFGNSTPRIKQIRKTLLSTPYSICLERPALLNDFNDSPDGRKASNEHPFVRRALALSHIYSNRKPRIYKDELIIGNMTSKRIAANYYPEGGSINILEDILPDGATCHPPDADGIGKMESCRYRFAYHDGQCWCTGTYPSGPDTPFSGFLSRQAPFYYRGSRNWPSGGKLSNGCS